MRGLAVEEEKVIMYLTPLLSHLGDQMLLGLEQDRKEKETEKKATGIIVFLELDNSE